MRTKGRVQFLLAGLVAILTFTTPCWAQMKEVKIGVIEPLTGSLASTGDEIRAGVQLAEDIINGLEPSLDMDQAKWNGIPGLGGAKLKFVWADHRSDPARGADLARRLIEDDKVVGLMGCWNSAVTMSVSAVAERLQVPMINSDSSSPSLVRRNYQYFWHGSLHIEMIADDIYRMLDYIAEQKIGGAQAKADVDRIAIVAENTEWGQAVKGTLEKTAKKYGYNVVASVSYNHRAPDLAAEVQALMKEKPNIVIAAAYVSDGILLMKTMKTIQFAPKVVMGISSGFAESGFTEALGKDAEGTMCIDYFFLQGLMKSKTAVAQVNALYKKRTGRDLTTASAMGFSSAQIWAYVLNAAKSTDPAAIQKTLSEINIPGKYLVMPYDGVKFEDTAEDKHQNRLGRAAITQIQKGEREVVFPLDVATAKIVFPFPSWQNR